MIILETINFPSLWYIIGYIVTDGNLSKDGRHITIVSKDIDHLEKIRTILSLKTPVGRKSNGNLKEKVYGNLQFSDVNFYKFLLNINIGPCKSLTQGPVNINPMYIDDFLRGIIDGDGCIYFWKHRNNKHIQWTLKITSASIEFINWLHKIIVDYYKIEGKIYCFKHKRINPIYILKFGKLNTQSLLKKIYYKECLCLERKLSIVSACLRDTSKMLNYESHVCPSAVIGSQD